MAVNWWMNKYYNSPGLAKSEIMQHRLCGNCQNEQKGNATGTVKKQVPD
jgi:hypothetical protein